MSTNTAIASDPTRTSDARQSPSGPDSGGWANSRRPRLISALGRPLVSGEVSPTSAHDDYSATDDHQGRRPRAAVSARNHRCQEARRCGRVCPVSVAVSVVIAVIIAFADRDVEAELRGLNDGREGLCCFRRVERLSR